MVFSATNNERLGAGRSRSLKRGLLAVRILLSILAVSTVSAVLLLTSTDAGAQAPIDPQAIALTLADLPPAFAVVPEKTYTQVLDQTLNPKLPGEVGTVYRILMERPRLPRYLFSGPVHAEQIIARIDQGIAPEEAFALLRERQIEERGLTLVPDGPNDLTTTTLYVRRGDGAAYVIGMLKGNFIIFTVSGGLPGSINLQGALALAGITAARYDSMAAQSPSAEVVPSGSPDAP